MTIVHTSPIAEVSIKEYRNILNSIRDKIECQNISNPFKSTEIIFNGNTIGEFCINVLLGLKEKRKKSRIKTSI